MPHIQEFYPHVHVIPYPFDVRFFSPAYPQATQHEPLIVHAPSDPYVKGTDYVLDAVSRLHNAGYEFTFQLVTLDVVSNKAKTLPWTSGDTVCMTSDVRDALPTPAPLVAMTNRMDAIHKLLAWLTKT